MPRSGALTLSDMKSPFVVVACASCGRRGRFAVSRLLEKYGDDIAMPDLLPELTKCPKWKSVSIYDRCKATYER
jgi:hypothetical protein